MSEKRAERGALECPVCGEVGVKACIDEQGRELDYDHDGRPPFFPPIFDAIWRQETP